MTDISLVFALPELRHFETHLSPETPYRKLSVKNVGWGNNSKKDIDTRLKNSDLSKFAKKGSVVWWHLDVI